MAIPDDKLNDIEEQNRAVFDRINAKSAEKFNPASSRSGNVVDINSLRNAEKESATGNKTNNTDNIKDTEERAGNSYINNFTGNNNQSKGGGVLKFAKKKGPMTSIILGVILSMFGLGGLASTTLLPISVIANMVKKYNSGSETSATVRAGKVMASKVMGGTTSGLCTPVTILCKFSRPSNKFLTKLEQSGIKALDEEGNVISKKLLFPNTRPASYSYIDSTGKPATVEAKKFYKTLVDDSTLRAAFHDALPIRFISLSDSIASKVKAIFNVKSTDKLAGATDEASLNSEIDKNTEFTNEVKTAAAAGDEVAAEKAAQSLITDETDAAISKVAKAGKASVVNLAAAGVCTITDVPSIISKTVRAIQLRQLIAFFFTIAPTLGAIKAGDATAAEVSALGAILTKQVNGKSAMDSFGMLSIMNDGMKPSNNNYKKMIPGGNIPTALNAINSVTESAAKKQACSVATNPWTGAAIDVALVDSVAGIPLAILNGALGIGLTYIIGEFLPPIIKGVVALIPMNKVLSLFYDFTKGLQGEPFGDGLASAGAHSMAQISNKGGNMPMTVPQAMAYNNTIQKVQLAYAQEDRATKSPLDASSPNTMLGSIVQKIAPYYAKFSFSTGSLGNNFAAISNMIVGSFGSALQPITAGAETADPSQYQMCDDPNIKDSGVAAGPFCEIMYGIPPEYLDKDPVDIVNKLVASGDIDTTTGEPVAGKDLELWLAICTDGKTDQAKNCEINTDEHANFALYTIDHRIQQAMDEDSTQ